MTTSGEIPWQSVFTEHRRYLWNVCYRLCGDVQDAEDLVQATFERALAHPPADRSRPWRPWLTRVASNLAIDLLRRRNHRGYDGPWLPAPVESLLEVEGWTREHHGEAPADVEVRYGQLESARFAFLLALEALDARARAVLILRDVLGYSGPEVGEVLELTPANVRVILHRARKALDAARPEFRARGPSTADTDARTRELIERFMAAVVDDDAEAMRELLSAEVRAVNDAGGEFRAARNVVTGAEQVSALFRGIARHGAGVEWAELRSLNGEPGLVARLPAGDARSARRVALRLELDADGRIAELHLILASRKLAGLPSLRAEPS